MNFNWIDGIARNAEHPDTFEIPSVEDKAALNVGDFIKIGGEIPSGRGERFWAIVKEINDEKIKAVVDNDLVLLDEFIDCGDVVEVETKHILAILNA